MEPALMEVRIMEDTIQKVINTLNTITVNGKQNLDRLLGCIMALERVLSEMHNKQTEDAESEV